MAKKDKKQTKAKNTKPNKKGAEVTNPPVEELSEAELDQVNGGDGYLKILPYVQTATPTLQPGTPLTISGNTLPKP